MNMLWKAMTTTLETMLYWEIYAAAVVYLILTFGSVLFFASLSRGVGAVLTLLIQPFFHALGIMVFVTLVAPIALGMSDDAAWHLPWKFVSETPWDVVKYSLQLVVVSVAIAFLPILGGLPSFNSLVLGVFATKMVFNLAGVEGISRSDLIPSLGVGFGILVIGAVVSMIGAIFATMIVPIITSILRQNAEDVSPLIIFPIVAALGFAPLLVYLSWLRVTLNY